MKEITIDALTTLGLDQTIAVELITQIKTITNSQPSPDIAWQTISQTLLTSHIPFNIHLAIFSALFPLWRQHPENAPAWIPDVNSIETTNIKTFMHEIAMPDIKTFHQWSITHYQDFWHRITQKLQIIFSEQPKEICDLSKGIESPKWFPDAKLNIADSCFNASPSSTALIYEDANNKITQLTYHELNNLSNRIANGLIKLGFKPGDAIAIAMPMNIYAIASYIGIIKMGGVVVSIADSFSSQEIAVRLEIAKSKGIITQDFINWANKQLPLYDKVCQATKVKIIVVPCSDDSSVTLRESDCAWHDFLSDNPEFTAVACDPVAACNILFSSGTTAEPKAIAWNHTTPIKAAGDAYFHQNIQTNDVLCWPTNLGWMMGPWLIFAALINQASIALYTKAPKDRAFGEYIQNANVTMLGVVPTLVAGWRQTQCMQGLNWRSIKTFSSSGECSNAEDMLYLMSLAGYKPVIEYCGGTEIGGAYISSTVIENNYPALFTTATMGLAFTILDEAGHTAKIGEVALIPPSIGLSTELLNADHHRVYFENMPKTANGISMRRHGDQIKEFTNHTFCILGRMDDSMNLGGIKISAAEIERVINGITNITEIAAIAITPPDNGPSQLVIYAATQSSLDKSIIMREMQKRINSQLNPLFKIHDIIFIADLPKTASNKIMRRTLRKQYMENLHNSKM